MMVLKIRCCMCFLPQRMCVFYPTLVQDVFNEVIQVIDEQELKLYAKLIILSNVN